MPQKKQVDNELIILFLFIFFFFYYYYFFNSMIERKMKLSKYFECQNTIF